MLLIQAKVYAVNSVNAVNAVNAGMWILLFYSFYGTNNPASTVTATKATNGAEHRLRRRTGATLALIFPTLTLSLRRK